MFEWTTKEGIDHSEHAVIIIQTEGECLASLHAFIYVPSLHNILQYCVFVKVV